MLSRTINTLYKRLPLLMIYLISVGYIPLNAQDFPVDNYLKQIGDNANIYNGKLETVYNTSLYDNYPYFISADFTPASIIYRNNYYPNQNVRLDLFKEQLIIIPPEKRFGIIVNSQNVEKVYMYDRVFVNLSPPKESGLKTGFYMLLMEGEKMQLFSKHSYNIQQNNVLTFYFDRKIQYYLLFNNKYSTVKDKGSFSKLFPQFKKQINQFSKENKLNFKKNADESLALIAGYCEKLINSMNK